MKMILFRKTVSPEKINSSMQRGIQALIALQQPDGSFPLYQRKGRKSWDECHALFSTVSVLLAVAPLLPYDVVSKAVKYILACRRSDGTWEFDPALGIPADADDTACALAVIARHDTSLVSASDTRILRSFWRPDKGPFRTWQADSIWAIRERDDAVVNCNVIHAIKETGGNPTTQEIEAVIRLIQSSTDGCRYYCSPETIGYAAIRAGYAFESLPEKITKKPKTREGILPMAQWLSITRQRDDDIVSRIISAQTKDGSWPSERWFTAIGNPTPVWGSPAISTALCIEALHCSIRE